MLVVVGGPCRNVGKTAVVVGLIQALPQAGWTAVKITPHHYGAGSPPAPYHLERQTEVDATDTGRFLAAGAARSYLLSLAGGNLRSLIAPLRVLLGASDHAIVETTRALDFLVPDLYLAVIHPGVDDVKESWLRHVDRVTACVVHDVEPTERWRRWLAGPLAGKPRFSIRPPCYVCEDLIRFVASRCGF
ncbi:MAG: hypothetical protein RMK57_01300 [Bryobacterales bacterium]|nr:hypothetical protein [Bryobacteraceae bacterium]MDW8353139.1 hypothetical protein [Bryobacterales bacterium]